MIGVVLIGFPATIGIAVFKYRLYDIDILINRTLVYGALTLMVATIYVLIVAGESRLLHNENNLIASLAATGVIAVLFHPVRAWLQSIVNRWLYGERDDPAGVLTRLTSQLETIGSGDSLLDVLVETIASSLKLPYVALWLHGEEGDLELTAQTGARPAYVETLPLMHQQETVGQLVVAPRAPGEAFSAAIEVAAFRVVQEAINNVIRHAQARRCTISITANGALEIGIRDDGAGLPAETRSGVGLQSMRERASEVGGVCTIENGEHGGVLVRLTLPIEGS